MSSIEERRYKPRLYVSVNLLRDSVVVRTRPRAISLAIITQEKKHFMGFLYFPKWRRHAPLLTIDRIG